MSKETEKIAIMAMDARDAAVRLCPHGTPYDERVRPWRELLCGLAESHGITIADALYTLTTDLKRVGLLDGAASMWLFAAFVEEALDRTEQCGNTNGGAS